MKHWISFPKVEGTATRQAHCDLPAGTYEREIGREGFFGPATQLHTKHPPVNWLSYDGPLKPRAFDLTKLKEFSSSPWGATTLLSNAVTAVRLWKIEGKMDHLVRNADGDDCLFFHEGSGDLFCDYGHLAYRDGDYIVLPRGTQWRIEAASPTTVLMIEATNDSYKLPEKAIMGAHAIFDPAMLDTPQLDEAYKDQMHERETRVVIKRQGQLTTVTFPFNPLDTVGWHGNLAPVRINWRDIRPLMSARYHVPPSAHATFLSNRVVICTFTPRPIESDPGALKLPYFHSNDDYEEFLFYHRGEFFSRDNIHPGMCTFHPVGFPHGPHPKAFKTAEQYSRKETDEVAVMVDCRDLLNVHDLPAGVEWVEYIDSWKTKG